MFVHAEFLVSADFDVALGGLRSLARAGWLTEASGSAYDSGMVGLARVGPFGDVPGVSKLVRVYVRDVLMREGSAVLTLRWEATGPGESMFPAMDADIMLAPAGPGRSRLTLDGAYRPPFAALGAGLDRLMLRRVAAPTAQSLLSQIAAAITDGPVGQIAGDGEASPGRPGDSPGDELPGPGPMI